MCDVSGAGAVEMTCCTMTVTSAVRENLSKFDAELNDVVNTCDIINVLDDLLNKAHTDFDDTRHAGGFARADTVS